MTVENQHHRLADDPAMPRPGDVLDDRYRIENVLGEGGFAAVFKATDAKTGKAFAVKVLDPIMSRRDEFRRRFFLEIANSSKLNHINTIHVSDQGETDTGCLYLVMELLEGKSLDELIDERGPMPAHLVRSVAVQTLRSLREAHNLNLLHRDIKPANIFIVENATDADDVFVKVVDFGIAKSMDSSNDAALTSTGQVMCSPHYVAPERIVDHHTYPSSDIYSLGISMIEMLEGKPPYDGENTIQLVMMHARMDSAVPMGENTLHSPLVDVIRRATHKDHSRRYQSADEMLDALRAVQGLQSGPATPSPLAALQDEIDALPTPPEWRQGGYWSIGAPLLVIITILMVGLFVWREFARNSEPDSQQTIAEQQVADRDMVQEKDVVPATSESDEEIDPNNDKAILGETVQPILRSDPEGAQIYIDNAYVGLSPWTFDLKDERLSSLPINLRLELQDGREHTERITDLSMLYGAPFEFSEHAAEHAARNDRPARAPNATTGSSPSSKAEDTRVDAGPDAKETPKPSNDASSSNPRTHPDSPSEVPKPSENTKPSTPAIPENPPSDTQTGEDLLEQLRKKNGGSGYGSNPDRSGGYYNR